MASASSEASRLRSTVCKKSVYHMSEQDKRRILYMFVLLFTVKPVFKRLVKTKTKDWFSRPIIT